LKRSSINLVQEGIVVTPQTKRVGIVLSIVAMVSFGAWPFWKALYFNSASAALQQRANELAEKNESLKTAWDVAMLDGVISQPEAELIIFGAGEKIETGK
jgi:hypothetical protein